MYGQKQYRELERTGSCMKKRWEKRLTNVNGQMLLTVFYVLAKFLLLKFPPSEHTARTSIEQETGIRKTSRARVLVQIRT